MIYTKVLTVPPNTPEYNPVYTLVNMTVGYLQGVRILFPDGCKGAVSVRIVDGGSQIFPVGGWVADNGREIIAQIGKRLQGSPFVVRLEGYSLAVDWEHNISFLLEVNQ